MRSTSTKEALTIIQDQGSTVRQQLRTKSVMPRVILISNVIFHHKSIIDHLSNYRIHKYSAAADNNCQFIVGDKTAGSAKRLKCPAVIKVGGEKDLIGHRCNGNWPFLTCPTLFLQDLSPEIITDFWLLGFNYWVLGLYGHIEHYWVGTVSYHFHLASVWILSISQ